MMNIKGKCTLTHKRLVEVINNFDLLGGEFEFKSREDNSNEKIA